MRKPLRAVWSFLNFDDPSHDPILAVPGLPMKFSMRTNIAIWVWAYTSIGTIMGLGFLFEWLIERALH